jgi:hypothetical protein
MNLRVSERERERERTNASPLNDVTARRKADPDAIYPLTLHCCFHCQPSHSTTPFFFRVETK